MNTLLTPLELSAVLDALDTRVEKLAALVLSAKNSPESDVRVAATEYRDRLHVLHRAREKIMLGAL